MLNYKKMKKITFLLIAIIVSMCLSCKQETQQETYHHSHMMNDSTMMHNDSTMIHHNEQMMHSDKMYSCPMHPEIHGNKNDKCSECGMDLNLKNAKTSE